MDIGTNWQVADLSEVSGYSILTDPVGWLTPSGERTVEHLAAVAHTGELFVFWSGQPIWPQAQIRCIDLTVSLYKTTSSTDERVPYERILEYFADAIYEMTNGMHKIRNIYIYEGGANATSANVVWNEKEWPRAAPSGYGINGQQLIMGDKFAFDPPYDALNQANSLGAGYTMGHEWGHFFYGLLDEYRCTNDDGKQPGDPKVCPNTKIEQPHSDDEPPTNSVMSDQWQARSGDMNWLNFSVAHNNIVNNRLRKTAHNRAFEASGWETVARPPTADPRDGERVALPDRLYYPELAFVRPAANQASSIELPTGQSEARSRLRIIWSSASSTTLQAAQGTDYPANVISLSGNHVSYPNPVLLIANVGEPDPIAKAGVMASVVDPQQSSTKIALRDNGLAPDVTADDGLYSGFMPYSGDGTYEVTVVFDNDSGNAKFTQKSYEHSASTDGELYVDVPVPVGESFTSTATTTIEVSNVAADDHGDTLAEATPLSTNNVDVTGRIDRAGDIDMFRITSNVEEQLTLRVTNLALGMQAHIRLLTEDGNAVAEFNFDPAQGGYFYTRLAITKSQTIYVAIAHTNDKASSGLYDISVGSTLGNGSEANETPAGSMYIPLVRKRE